MFIIGVLVALGVLVIVHEFGHYSAARLLGVTVEKFSVGFGPKIAGIKKGATEFLISAIPLGGYVKMKGDQPDEKQNFKEDDFYGISWWKRIIIVFAGPFANLILGIVLLSGSFFVGRIVEDQAPVIGQVDPKFGQYFQPDDRIIAVNNNEVDVWSQLFRYTLSGQEDKILLERDGSSKTITATDIEPEDWFTKILPAVEPVIGTVAPGMPAYRSGLKEGDYIKAVGDEEVKDWYDMRRAIIDYPDDEAELLIVRNDSEHRITVPLEVNLMDDSGGRIIGITQQMAVQTFEKYNLPESIQYGFYSSINFIIMNYQALFKIITNPFLARDHLGGPVMIVTMSRQTSHMGWGAIIAFVASISLILMIMNLLPIPVLDGGHIFFFLIEGIFRRPLGHKTQIVIQQIGFLLLMTLMVFAFYNDISRIVRRSFSLREHQVNQEIVEEE